MFNYVQNHKTYENMFWARNPFEVHAATYVGLRITGSVELFCLRGEWFYWNVSDTKFNAKPSSCSQVILHAQTDVYNDLKRRLL